MSSLEPTCEGCGTQLDFDERSRLCADCAVAVPLEKENASLRTQLAAVTRDIVRNAPAVDWRAKYVLAMQERNEARTQALNEAAKVADDALVPVCVDCRERIAAAIRAKAGAK